MLLNVGGAGIFSTWPSAFNVASSPAIAITAAGPGETGSETVLVPIVPLGAAGFTAAPVEPATVEEPPAAGATSVELALLLVVFTAAVPNDEVTAAAAEPFPAAELELSDV